MKIYIAFALGIILTVFSYQAYTIYQLRTTVADDHANLQQVVTFLNTQIQASQQAQAGQQGSVAAPVQTNTTTKR